MAQNLEQKTLDEATRQNWLNNFVYLNASQNPNEKITLYSEDGKSKEIGVTYTNIALQQLAANTKDETQRLYLQTILQGYAENMQRDGMITPKSTTMSALKILENGYNTALAQTPFGEFTSLARNLGYKDKLPDFLADIKATTVSQLEKEIKEKLESNDEKTKVRGEALLNTYKTMRDVVAMHARYAMLDKFIGENFEMFGEMYSNPEKVIDEKKNREAARERPGAEEQEGD